MIPPRPRLVSSWMSFDHVCVLGMSQLGHLMSGNDEKRKISLPRFPTLKNLEGGERERVRGGGGEGEKSRSEIR